MKRLSMSVITPIAIALCACATAWADQDRTRQAAAGTKAGPADQSAATIVTTADELDAAMRSDSSHVVITQHLNLTSLPVFSE